VEEFFWDLLLNDGINEFSVLILQGNFGFSAYYLEDYLVVPDLPIGCIGCSQGALEVLGPKNDEKELKFFGTNDEIAHWPRAQN
jgi:hypothetical protein